MELLKRIAPFAATWVVLTGIKTAFGLSAAFWFGLGGLIVAVLAMWEAGGRNLSEKEKGR